MDNKKLFKFIINKYPAARYVAKSVRNVFFPVKTNLHTVSIEISSICNARCIFCNYKNGYRSPKIINSNCFEKTANACVEFGYQKLNLTSMGGEVFTNPEVIEMIKIAKRVGFKTIATYTNGILINRFDNAELLQSGLKILLISFPGFSHETFAKVFQVNSFDDFVVSISSLLETHKKIKSDVTIIFEPRTYLTAEQICESDFFVNVVSRYLGDYVHLEDPLEYYDTWGGDITQGDLIDGMKIEPNPIKSIYPFKKTYLCQRLQMLGILSNGDVRLCNCRYDSSIETDSDPLFIDNIYRYKNLSDLICSNKAKITKFTNDYINGKLPNICRSCCFYAPQLESKLFEHKL